ncbi:tetratricopeptide repeat protein, partial [Treponema pedis]
DNADIEYTLKGISFWGEKIKLAEQISTPLERGEYMIANWKPFLKFMERQGENREAVIYALKCAVFTMALKFYAELLREETVLQNAEPYLRVGLCYKALGDYERGLEFLKYAAELNKNSASVLAELADCYALYGEMKFSKAFFREAFFINPSDIELQFLESEIIKRLIRKVEKLGYSSELVSEWIPVYGVLDGVFNVKRELRSYEFGQLKQKIFLLENEEREKTGEQHARLVPRLIN